MRFPADGSLGEGAGRIDNVPRFCAAALNDVLGRTAASLPEDLKENFVGDLIVVCYDLYQRKYDGRKGFRQYIGPILRARVVESYRRWFVDVRYHPEWQAPLSLDSPVGDGDESLSLGDTIGVSDRLPDPDPRAVDGGVVGAAGGDQARLVAALRRRVLEHSARRAA